MTGKLAKLLLLDVALIAFCALVFQNLQWMLSYASSPHAATDGYAPGFAYGLLTHTFSMSGGPLILASPPTLDWLQVGTVLLVVLNVWYLLERRTASRLSNHAEKYGPDVSR